MRRCPSSTPVRVSAMAVVIAVVALAACSSVGGGVGPTSSAPAPAMVVPLDATLSSTTGAVAIVAMGRLSDRLNTFWQLFRRSTAASKWTIATPLGVASNGGLVASTTVGLTGGESVVAGFEPSQDLRYSPLALSADGGRSWSPGFLPVPLASVPDALSASTGTTTGTDEYLALVRAKGGEVLRSAGGASEWSELVDRDALRSSPTGGRCEVGALTAVAGGADSSALVGTSCRVAGMAGIFGFTAGSWHLVGPRLSGRPGSEPTRVVRLDVTGDVTSAMVATVRASTTTLVGVARVGVGAWVQSPPLALGAASRIVSTGVESGGGYVVLVSRSEKPLGLEAERGPGLGWQSLPSPPPGTATVDVAVLGEVDALAVDSTRLTDWRLSESTGRWRKVETVTVPIQFGSSD